MPEGAQAGIGFELVGAYAESFCGGNVRWLVVDEDAMVCFGTNAREGFAVNGGFGFKEAQFMRVEAGVGKGGQVDKLVDAADVGGVGIGDDPNGVIAGQLAGKGDIGFNRRQEIFPVVDECFLLSAKTEKFSQFGKERLTRNFAALITSLEGIVVGVGFEKGKRVGTVRGEGFPNAFFLKVEKHMAEVEKDVSNVRSACHKSLLKTVSKGGSILILYREKQKRRLPFGGRLAERASSVR